MMDLRVDFPRLQADLEELASIGRREDHGIYRVAFSDEDMQARAWLQDKIRAAGLDLYVDGAANIHGRLGPVGERPSVVTGSHLDTVPRGGHLDGALGVVAGLECLRRIAEEKPPLSFPVELISFTDEEGRFGGMPGSQAIAGKLTPEAILSARDLAGVTLVEAMRARGLDAMHALRARYKPDSLHAFIELHIEQGPVLERRGAAIGAVEGIAGLFKWNASFLGKANHAGTTPLDMRNDAFMGLVEAGSAIPRILEEHGGGRSVATIGRVQLHPGAANVVPGRADFTLEARDVEAHALESLSAAFRRTMSAIARRRGLMFEFELLSELAPVSCDAGIVSIVEEVAAGLGQSCMRMPSGAAHDTQQLASITRAGMIFVPSKDGRSHSPAEWTPWESIEAGANVLLGSLIRLAA